MKIKYLQYGSLTIGIILLIFGVRLQTTNDFFSLQLHRFDIRLLDSKNIPENKFGWNWDFNAVAKINKNLDIKSDVTISRSIDKKSEEDYIKNFPEGFLFVNPELRLDILQIKSLEVLLMTNKFLNEKQNKKRVIEKLNFTITDLHQEKGSDLSYIYDNHWGPILLPSYLFLFKKPKTSYQVVKNCDNLWLEIRMKLKRDSDFSLGTLFKEGLVKLDHHVEVGEYIYHGIDTVYDKTFNRSYGIIRTKKQNDQRVAKESVIDWDFKGGVIRPEDRTFYTRSQLHHTFNPEPFTDSYEIKYKGRKWLSYLATLLCIPFLTFGFNGVLKKFK